MMDQVNNADTADSTYKSLYKLGGAAALIVAVLTLSEVIGLAFYPQPGTVSGWFTLFQRNKLIGLLDFWGLEVPMYVMFIIVFLALYVVLRKANQGLMVIALTFALLGIGIFLATNNPFAMLSLSNQYAAATTDAERSTFLAAGQALLANTNQRAVGGFNMGLFLVSVAGLIVSSVMFQSKSFSRLTAYVGILAYALSLADYLRQALTTSAIVALLVILPNALFLVIWFVLVGWRLYQLRRLEGKTLPKQPGGNMSASVLVAYATRYGSTQEVAEAVAATLRECGLEVDIQPMRKVRTLARYRAVVLGAPLFMFHWHKDALGFLSRHRRELVERPVAVFALGPVHDPHDEKEWEDSRSQLDKELAKHPWFKPIALEMFGGKYDPAKLGFPLNKMAGKEPASDIRDWTAIRAWATSLAPRLQSAPS